MKKPVATAKDSTFSLQPGKTARIRGVKVELFILSLLSLAAGSSGLATPAGAAVRFEQQEVEQSRMIAIAAPIGSGQSHQLLILEQVNNSRPCWRERAGSLTLVEPLLLEFDFTNICNRSTDSNGYSVRVAGEDLGWRYALRVVKQDGNLMLLAVPTIDRTTPPIQIGRVNGITSGFAKFSLNSGWRFTRRVYNGQPIGHIYLTHDQSLTNLIAASPRPASLSPVVSSRPSAPVPVPSPVASAPTVPGAIAPAPSTRPLASTSSSVIVPTLPIQSPLPPLQSPLPTPPSPPSNPDLPIVLVPSTLPPRSSSPATLGFNYRVVVQADTPAQQQQVRAIAPGAFRTTVDGRAVMQAGLFRDQATAATLQQQLMNRNLSARILPVSGASPLPSRPSAPTTGLTMTRFDLPEPATPQPGRAYSLWATYYYLHQAPTIARGNPLLDPAGTHLGAELSDRDWCAAALQGSVAVMNGDQSLGTYNYAGRGATQQVDCSVYYPRLGTVRDTSRVRFKRSNTPFGEGVSGFMLVPYRTIAVDRSVIPIGSVVYIPEARGQVVTLPSGATAVHDGYFYAADVGGAIRGNHIDVFIGPSRQNPFPFVRSTANSSFRAYLVNDSQIRLALKSLHRPGSATAAMRQQ
jgi:N-acetylmuramoyl-L-alanine amidase